MMMMMMMIAKGISTVFGKHTKKMSGDFVSLLLLLLC